MPILKFVYFFRDWSKELRILVRQSSGICGVRHAVNPSMGALRQHPCCRRSVTAYPQRSPNLLRSVQLHFIFASLEFNSECLLLAPIALERGVQLRSAISNLRAAIESGGCRVYPGRTFNSMDAVVEPTWMYTRRVLTGYTRQPADRTKLNTTELTTTEL